MQKRHKLAVMTAALFFVFGTALARAEDKADPSGTWKWTINRPDGVMTEATATLKWEKDKLTGVTVRNKMELPIEEGKFKDGEVSFVVKPEVNGQKVVAAYKGKLTGDTIKGSIKVKFPGADEDVTLEWEAKREKESEISDNKEVDKDQGAH